MTNKINSGLDSKLNGRTVKTDRTRKYSREVYIVIINSRYKLYQFVIGGLLMADYSIMLWSNALNARR